ncbi:phosphoribosyltransferase family protein [Cryobacterium fucosi]|nr:phosphoribosyltransferase family protein [Cryobacterium fucosi]
MVVFADRVDAGSQLAERLLHLRDRDVVVLGLPRGGVPVAFAVAEALHAPLDVIVVRKLGVPYQPELAMGAIGEGGARVLNPEVLTLTGVTAEELGTVERRERTLLDERVASLRMGRERLDLTGRTVVIVDDGIATGSTARVACDVARHLGAATVIMAAPVVPAETVGNHPGADEVVCVLAPRQLVAVGNHYRDFSATSDEEVVVLLDAAAKRMRNGRVVGDDVARDVEIPADGVLLEGHLRLPEGAAGIVVFAHGSGSSRHSPRNQFVAEVLLRAGLGTLLLDLLTADEEPNRSNVFDIELLANRLTAATAWLRHRPETAQFRIGYFGASTGAGAALWAAAEPGSDISAIVSRGGRPDLAGARLPLVQAPTLLIVGGADEVVLELNRQAKARLHCRSRLTVVDGATHLFEEPGTLAAAANLAADWFSRYLIAEPTGS